MRSRCVWCGEDDPMDWLLATLVALLSLLARPQRPGGARPANGPPHPLRAMRRRWSRIGRYTPVVLLAARYGLAAHARRRERRRGEPIGVAGNGTMDLAAALQQAGGRSTPAHWPTAATCGRSPTWSTGSRCRSLGPGRQSARCTAGSARRAANRRQAGSVRAAWHDRSGGSDHPRHASRGRHQPRPQRPVTTGGCP